MQVDGEVLQFMVLPFGLSIVPRVFTKITKPMAEQLAWEGINTLFYLDDWLIIANSEDAATMATATTVDITQRMGFLVNTLKSKLTPAQRLVCFGMEWDTAQATLALSADNRLRYAFKL